MRNAFCKLLNFKLWVRSILIAFGYMFQFLITENNLQHAFLTKDLMQLSFLSGAVAPSVLLLIARDSPFHPKINYELLSSAEFAFSTRDI